MKDLDGGFVVLDQGRREGPFDLVVDALGSRSPLISHAAGPDYRSALGYGAIWASLPWPGAPFDVNALEQRYDRASVMIGVLPIGRQVEGAAEQAAFFWSLKAAEFENWQRAGLDPWKRTVLGHWPNCAGLLETVTDASQMVMARYDHHTLSLPFGRRLVFIGDSAHATSPQLGQGANMALLDVHALASALKENADLRDALESYARKRRFHVKLYQGLSRVFTPFYQSELDVAADGAGPSGFGHQPHRPRAEAAGADRIGQIRPAANLTGGTPQAWCPCSFGLALKTGCR